MGLQSEIEPKNSETLNPEAQNLKNLGTNKPTNAQKGWATGFVASVETMAELTDHWHETTSLLEYPIANITQNHRDDVECRDHASQPSWWPQESRWPHVKPSHATKSGNCVVSIVLEFFQSC